MSNKVVFDDKLSMTWTYTKDAVTIMATLKDIAWYVYLSHEVVRASVCVLA